MATMGERVWRWFISNDIARQRTLVDARVGIPRRIAQLARCGRAWPTGELAPTALPSEHACVRGTRRRQAVVVVVIIHAIVDGGVMRLWTPTGVTNGYALYDGPGWDKHDGTGSAPQYCNNPDWDFFWSADWAYENIQCRHYHSTEVGRGMRVGWMS